MTIELAVALWVATSGLMAFGNTAGFHRLLTHRSFEAAAPIRCGLTLLSALHSGSPRLWVGVHRMHHAFADTDLDPHSASHGLLYAHCGWLFFGTRRALPCVLFAISGFGLQLRYLITDIRRFLGLQDAPWRAMSRDLGRERLMRLLDVPMVIPALFGLQVAAAWSIGGAWGLLWLWALHVVQTNVSWSINSVCHGALPGPGTADSGGRSRDVAWLAWPTLGDSFHGCHHDRPSSACHALEGGTDITWLLICALHRLGLVDRIQLPAGVFLPIWAMREQRQEGSSG